MTAPLFRFLHCCSFVALLLMLVAGMIVCINAWREEYKDHQWGERKRALELKSLICFSAERTQDTGMSTACEEVRELLSHTAYYHASRRAISLLYHEIINGMHNVVAMFTPDAVTKLIMVPVVVMMMLTAGCVTCMITRLMSAFSKPKLD